MPLVNCKITEVSIKMCVCVGVCVGGGGGGRDGMGADALLSFYAIFHMGDKFCVFLLAFMQIKSFLKKRFV